MRFLSSYRSIEVINQTGDILMTVCTKNLIRIDWVKESPNVSAP
jgi:hypothetical protein